MRKHGSIVSLSHQCLQGTADAVEYPKATTPRWKASCSAQIGPHIRQGMGFYLIQWTVSLLSHLGRQASRQQFLHLVSEVTGWAGYAQRTVSQLNASSPPTHIQKGLPLSALPGPNLQIFARMVYSHIYLIKTRGNVCRSNPFYLNLASFYST